MIAPDATALGVRAEAMISELAAISAESGRLVRLFLTPEHRRAGDEIGGAAVLRRQEQAHELVGLGRNRAEGIHHQLGARAECVNVDVGG